jgi:hypothetical protein
MARPEITGRKAGPAKTAPAEVRITGPPIGEPVAYTIREFCKAHRISESFYHKLKSQGLGPRESHALGKITITGESARDWRRQNETAAETV